MIFVNFKIYRQTFGEGAVKLAKICREVAEKSGVNIIPVVSSLDLYRVKNKVGGDVYLQGGDIFFEGAHTGAVSFLQAIVLGADGMLLNHSEKKLSPGTVSQILVRLKKDIWVKKLVGEYSEFKDLEEKINKFKIIVCIRTKGQAEKWAKKLKPRPDLFAYEPPELIGGKLSVSSTKPEAIKKIVKLLSGTGVIVGAGVKTKTDVKKSLELGAKGVLVSSDVVKASDPKKELAELAEAFSK